MVEPQIRVLRLVAHLCLSCEAEYRYLTYTCMHYAVRYVLQLCPASLQLRSRIRLASRSPAEPARHTAGWPPDRHSREVR